MDTCLGNFRQLFAQSTPYYDYSFDLLDTGRYYLHVRPADDALAARYCRAGSWRSSYEQIVEDQEGTTRSACWRIAGCLGTTRACASSDNAGAGGHRQRWRRCGSRCTGRAATLEALRDPQLASCWRTAAQKAASA
jgi:hypothetical protein